MSSASSEILDKSLDLAERESYEFIAIVGPTASGKTELALDLAQKLGLEIINADSRLIYKGMDIGTAKPNHDELSRVKHHLIDIRTPDQSYSAGDFRRDFDNLSAPKSIIVGGTGLYLSAALEDLALSEIPSDHELRAKLQSRLKNEGLDNLRTELLSQEPEAAQIVDLQNPLRVLRALEITILSPKSLAETRSRLSHKRHKVLYIGLNYADRDLLYQRINTRVLSMIKDGLVSEVENLLAVYGPDSALSSTIGYKEILDYLAAKHSLDEAIALIQKHSRNYAKRQLTWFRRNHAINWFYK